MTHYTQAAITVLSLVNPLICVSMFSKSCGSNSRSEQFGMATQAALSVALVLALAAIGGEQVLKSFGISLDAFQVAGGLVLTWMGFGMLQGNSSPDSSDGESPSLTSLIVFAASPGTITGVITLSVSDTEHGMTTALVAVAIAIAVMWIALVLSVALQKQEPKKGLLQDVMPRFMGLIVLSMGVQFVLTGLAHFKV